MRPDTGSGVLEDHFAKLPAGQSCLGYVRIVGMMIQTFALTGVRDTQCMGHCGHCGELTQDIDGCDLWDIAVSNYVAWIEQYMQLQHICFCSTTSLGSSRLSACSLFIVLEASIQLLTV